ncbi:thioredoxin-related transmembrane protein 4 [Callorhinchus milii]|uniref:thioredoxin-related transmembrane protein 4 n=1 Tax=Callorhinchus milii TaxID=7868 RepID=UPI001C3F55AE|nr:thioredoxin-related transmembrane protein 4 [Callorhinchus milii]
MAVAVALAVWLLLAPGGRGEPGLGAAGPGLGAAGPGLGAAGPGPGLEAAVQQVGDANWTVILSGEWMVQFHAPWCPACQQIQADWEKLGKLSETIGIRVGKVDVTREPGLSGRFFVTTLPTIYHAKDGVFRKYHGSRVLQDFQSFVTEKKWETLESISGWKSPSSFAMSGMAGLFRLSVWIREVHSYLTETLGIPVWGSYIAFAMVTLLAGLILGLILVLIADCLCPTKSKYKSQVTETTEKDDEDMEDEESNHPQEETDLDWDLRTAEGNNLSDNNSGDDSPQEEASPEENVCSGEDASRGKESTNLNQPSSDSEEETSVRKRKTIENL